MADILLYLSATLAGVAMILVFVRFVLGPTVSDRVAAFDVLTIISITAIVMVALVSGRSIYLDVALIYALLSFLGVVVVARYKEGGF
ncbi:multiple resistance and pH regulation protein F [Magnetococcus marinus MC-1]|uniref:Multiple resistance and pH regulation protein F n=1 Tax=Magnetococcus marinus (strain ATCC BAA-1437 / JCM 17883 / MC-1) TaxID=156889 RepID=A0L9S3_MAGMM|nr:monovalent cation/H+ antiporter complex subunit F [Magnetococcus marinus]ABK44716.1 multiple resistance and pH regulation protein F [Magnetococcus marinus MC-1]